MKNSYYFNHYYHFSQTENMEIMISELGVESYGIYWIIVESMALSEKSGISERNFKLIAKRFDIPIEKINSVVEYCLENEVFVEVDENICDVIILEHKQIRERLGKFGKLGASKRWRNIGTRSNGNSPPIGDPNSPPNGQKERKKERKKKGTSESIQHDLSENDLPDFLKPSKEK